MTGIRFDKTINLGHILTFLGFVAAIWTTSSTLHTRLVLVEERQRLQELKDADQDARAKESARDLKDALRDIHSSMEKLADLQRTKK